MKDILGYNQDSIDKGKSAYESGEYAEALELLLPSAENNNADAQAIVGSIFLLSSDGERDLDKAIFWLERASRNGRGDAAHNLSTLYVTCEPEMPRDTDKSKFWLRRARELGYIVAPDEWYDSIIDN
jgi:uncharacterized protein